MTTPYRAFELVTGRGRFYVLDDKGTERHGAIIRTDMAFYPSQDWKMQCIYTARGRYVGTWRPLFVDGTFDDGAHLLKNGKGKYAVGDFDHGTARMWGSSILSVKPVYIEYNATTDRWVTVHVGWQVTKADA